MSELKRYDAEEWKLLCEFAQSTCKLQEEHITKLEAEIAKLKEKNVCEYKHIETEVNNRMFKITCLPDEVVYFPVGWIKDYCAYCGGKIESK